MLQSPVKFYSNQIILNKSRRLCDLTIRLLIGYWTASRRPISLRIMTSQFKDNVTHMQNYKTIKCIFCGVWVQKFCVKFQRCPLKFHKKFHQKIHCKICIWWGVKNLTCDILELWHLKSWWDGPQVQCQCIALNKNILKHENTIRQVALV